jgi:hypothetical protein
MSQRTNEELLERHEAGLSVYKSDEDRLGRLIAAAYANKRARELEAALSGVSAVSSQMRPATENIDDRQHHSQGE